MTKRQLTLKQVIIRLLLKLIAGFTVLVVVLVLLDARIVAGVFSFMLLVPAVIALIWALMADWQQSERIQ